VNVEQANVEKGTPVNLELTEYVLLAFLVMLGVLVRHRMQRHKSQPPPQQGADSPKSSGRHQES